MADQSSRAGKRYADEKITEWVARVHAPHDAALQRAVDAPGANGRAANQGATRGGQPLGTSMKLSGARKAVEAGTLAGYSALQIGRALPQAGKLYTIEIDPKPAEIARANIAAAGLGDRVEVRVGAGASVLEQLAPLGPFD